MGQMTEQMRSTLIATVRIVRSYKGSMSEDTLFDRGVKSNLFRAVRSYIRRANVRGEQNQGVVQCIEVSPNTVATSNVYDCRPCPLFKAGNRCDAGQGLKLDHADDRAAGPGASRAWRGTVPRRRTSP